MAPGTPVVPMRVRGKMILYALALMQEPCSLYHSVFWGYIQSMIIEQTVEIPESGILRLELPRPFPAGIKARVEISIPAVLDIPKNSVAPKSFRGVLKGKGITLERFRAIQQEDMAIEDEADNRIHNCSPKYHKKNLYQRGVRVAGNLTPQS
jgi:hypothetical protein